MENNIKSQGDCQSSGEQSSGVTGNGVIYVITNKLNGKPYVGQTKQGLKRRIIEHKRDSSKARSGIDMAIRKYG